MVGEFGRRSDVLFHKILLEVELIVLDDSVEVIFKVKLDSSYIRSILSLESNHHLTIICLEIEDQLNVVETVSHPYESLSWLSPIRWKLALLITIVQANQSVLDV